MTERNRRKRTTFCVLFPASRSMSGYSLIGEHTIDTGPPERLERRVGQCEAIDETGERCKTLTLHSRCWRHRRQLREESAS